MIKYLVIAFAIFACLIRPSVQAHAPFTSSSEEGPLMRKLLGGTGIRCRKPTNDTQWEGKTFKTTLITLASVNGDLPKAAGRCCEACAPLFKKKKVRKYSLTVGRRAAECNCYTEKATLVKCEDGTKCSGAAGTGAGHYWTSVLYG